MARKIIGFEKFTSKKGLPCCAVSVQTEFSPRDNVTQLGIKSEICMIYGDEGAVINKDSIGKELVGFFGYGTNGVCSVQSPAVK